MEEVEKAYDQGCRYLQGDGVTRDYEKGIEYLRQAADLGSAKAQYNLGICLHQGTGSEEAYHYFQLAAKQGHPRAYYLLGCYFAFGFLFPPSETEALHYFRLAADGGIVEAQYNLAIFLLHEKETEKAVHYFKLAAHQGNADAQYNLGICYYKGLGTSASRDKAIHYLELALEQGQSKASEALETVLMNS